MADIIAIAIGRGRDSGATCTRLATRGVEVRANTWRTFVTVVMQTDGRAVITIQRGDDRADSPVLSEITINSEHADTPIIMADGLPLLRSHTR